MNISPPTRGIPVPERKYGRPPPSPLTAALMELGIGESVLITDTDTHKARWVAHGWAKQAGRKVATRTTTKGLRIWRTA